VSDSFRFFTAAPLESPAGNVASDLESLKAGIATVSPESIFHHVIRMPVRFPHVRDLPENDFARWVGDALQLPEVSERLAFAGTLPAGSLEEVRAALLAVLNRVPERDRRRSASEDAAFQFLESRTVIADFGLEAADPAQVVELWPQLDGGATFLHLVEAPIFGRTEFALIPWLRARGARGLADSAAKAVAAGPPVMRLHRDIGTRWRRSMIGRRLVERIDSADDVRLREARETMVRLATKLKGTDAGGRK
jgi:Family of unknown function (DUF5752)